MRPDRSVAIRGIAAGVALSRSGFKPLNAWRAATGKATAVSLRRPIPWRRGAFRPVLLFPLLIGGKADRSRQKSPEQCRVARTPLRSRIPLGV
jgi:hypothetical protein